MNEYDLLRTLNELLALPHETEWVEFKEANSNYDFNKIGQYFSALSNEANLNHKPCAWLVFGVKDNHTICGSKFRSDKSSLDSLKHELAVHTDRISFLDIFEVAHPNGRVIMLQIPPAPQGIPVAFKGHYYGRDGESVVALSLPKFERIRSQLKHIDWSAGICDTATIDDLDPVAIQRAREIFSKKATHLTNEIQTWDDITFLNKSKITIKGKITRTAILLLGRPETEHYLSPGIAKISWILKDEHNQEKDYQHFGPPFLLTVEQVYAKIRNLNYRYLLDNSLFPTEILTYEPYVIREALNNCIAHQDYTLGGRIQVVESPENLLFTNLGSFLPGIVENVINQDAPQEFYRNHFLAQAMVNLNLIDTQGGGIKRMFSLQMHRYFPLPDYDLSDVKRVKVKIAGKVIDENYTRLLKCKADLDLKTVILLDRVQKKEFISKEDAVQLKKEKLIEGRYPSVFITATLADATDKKAEYIRNRSFNDDHYKKMILEYLKKFKTASKSDIENLLMDKLSDVLSDEKKKNKIRNLLHSMSKKDCTIIPAQKGKYAKWTISC